MTPSNFVNKSHERNSTNSGESLTDPIAVKMDVYGQISRFPTSQLHRRESDKSYMSQSRHHLSVLKPNQTFSSNRDFLYLVGKQDGKILVYYARVIRLWLP